MDARRRAAKRGRGQPAAAPAAEAGAEAAPPSAVRDERLRSSSSRTLRLLLALLALPFCAPQTCPNRCSGHGRCNCAEIRGAVSGAQSRIHKTINSH
jgi:hypothetical protein